MSETTQVQSDEAVPPRGSSAFTAVLLGTLLYLLMLLVLFLPIYLTASNAFPSFEVYEELESQGVDIIDYANEQAAQVLEGLSFPMRVYLLFIPAPGACLAGYVAVRIRKRHPLRIGIYLALVITVVALYSLDELLFPAWLEALGYLLSIAAVILGAHLAGRQLVAE